MPDMNCTHSFCAAKIEKKKWNAWRTESKSVVRTYLRHTTRSCEFHRSHDEPDELRVLALPRRICRQRHVQHCMHCFPRTATCSARNKCYSNCRKCSANYFIFSCIRNFHPIRYEIVECAPCSWRSLCTSFVVSYPHSVYKFYSFLWFRFGWFSSFCAPRV